MSEPRKLNTGDAQRNVYHAGDAQSANPTRRTVSTAQSRSSVLSQEQYEEARRQAQAAAAQAARSRRTQSVPRVSQSDVDARRAAQQAARAQAQAQMAAQPETPTSYVDGDQGLTRAQRQAMALRRQAEQHRIQSAAAAPQQRRVVHRAPSSAAPQIRQLDLKNTQAQRQHYDVNADEGFAERTQPAQAAASAQAAPQAAASQVHRAASSGGSGSAASAGRSGRSSGGAGQPPKGPKNGRKGGAGGSGGGKGGNKKKKKGGWWKALLGTLLAIVLIFAGTAFFILRAIAPEAGSISISELINTPKEYAGKEYNILVVGVDRSTEDGSGEDSQSNDGLTDMILYLHFNNETGDVRMLQIPRNILVTDDTSVSGNYMINGVAKTQGTNGNNNISALAQLIYDQFGLPVDGYISVRLEALTQMIDTFGGIQVYVPQEMDYNGSHLDAGYQTMDGAAAEFFLRTRHIYADSDIGRLNMQRYFYAALFARLRSMNVWDIAKLLPVFVSYMETDLNVTDLVSVAVSMLNISSDHIMMCQIPVYMGQIYYPIGSNNDVVVVDRQGTADLLNTYFRENLGPMDPSALGVRDDLVDVSGRTPTDPSIQFMGSLNEEIVDAQQNDNIDNSVTTDVYDVTSSEATDGTEGAEGTDGAESTETTDGGEAEPAA